MFIHILLIFIPSLAYLSVELQVEIWLFYTCDICLFNVFCQYNVSVRLTQID